MREPIRGGDLLRRAAVIFDDPRTGLAAAARRTPRWGFASGGAWMREALRQVRARGPGGPGAARPVPELPVPFRRLGLLKYGLASLGGLAGLALARRRRSPALALLGVPLFYAVEAQLVFLFPLAIDGAPRPFAEARALTAAAGGTLAVMPVVMRLAATMLLGGLAGGGAVRAWCLGCLAVCIWYEEVRA